MNRKKRSAIGFVVCTALIETLTGCIGHGDGPHHGRVHFHHSPLHVADAVLVHDDYVYYPSYQVYHSGNTRQYICLEDGIWISRPTPPRVSAAVLFASPSVRMDFHDAPAVHHASLVQMYPMDWAPPGWSHGNKGGNPPRHNPGKSKGKGKK